MIKKKSILTFMAFIAGAGAAAAFLGDLGAFMAFMAFGMVKIGKWKGLAERLQICEVIAMGTHVCLSILNPCTLYTQSCDSNAQQHKRPLTRGLKNKRRKLLLP